MFLTESPIYVCPCVYLVLFQTMALFLTQFINNLFEIFKKRPKFTIVYAVACLIITKTCLNDFDSLKPHFYIVKLGFTGIYIIFLIFGQKKDCGYSLEPPHRDGSNGYP